MQECVFALNSLCALPQVYHQHVYLAAVGCGNYSHISTLAFWHLAGIVRLGAPLVLQLSYGNGGVDVAVFPAASADVDLCLRP